MRKSVARLTVHKGENKPVLRPSRQGVLEVEYQQLIVMQASLM